MKLYEAKQILKKNGYRYLNEAQSKGFIFGAESGQLKNVTFIASFMSIDYGEPAEEKIVASNWAVALQKALQMADETDLNLISLKLDDIIADQLWKESDHSDDDDDDDDE